MVDTANRRLLPRLDGHYAFERLSEDHDVHAVVIHRAADEAGRHRCCEVQERGERDGLVQAKGSHRMPVARVGPGVVVGDGPRPPSWEQAGGEFGSFIVGFPRHDQHRFRWGSPIA